MDRLMRKKFNAVLLSKVSMGKGSCSSMGQRVLIKAPLGQTDTQCPQDMQDISLIA